MKPLAFFALLAALLLMNARAVEVRQVELRTAEAVIPLYNAKPHGPDIAAIVSYYGHMQNPNAPEPDQLFRVAPEIMQLTTPMLFLIGEQDFELRRMVGGRAFYALWERGVPVEYQVYPFARRAFDFRADQGPEERIATRHARQKADQWRKRWMRLDAQGRCP